MREDLKALSKLQNYVLQLFLSCARVMGQETFPKMLIIGQVEMLSIGTNQVNFTKHIFLFFNFAQKRLLFLEIFLAL